MIVFRLADIFRTFSLKSKAVSFLFFLNIFLSALTGCANPLKSNYYKTDNSKQSTLKEILIDTCFFDETPYILKATKEGFLISDGRYVNLYNIRGELLEYWDLKVYFKNFEGSAYDVGWLCYQDYHVIVANNNQSMFLLYIKNNKVYKNEEFDNGGGYNIRIQNNYIYTNYQMFNDITNIFEKKIRVYEISESTCKYNGAINDLNDLSTSTFEIVNDNLIYWNSDRNIYRYNTASNDVKLTSFDPNENVSVFNFLGLDSNYYILQYFDDSLKIDKILLCNEEFIVNDIKDISVDYSSIVANSDFFYQPIYSGLIFSYYDKNIYVLLIKENSKMSIHNLRDLLI